MNNEIYKSIDQILGDKEKRFFSNGFKNVKHAFKQIVIRPTSNEMSATGTAIYPDNWSVKQGQKLKPHLSTLDVLVFTFCLNILFVNEVYRLNESQRESTWVRKVTVRAAAEARYDLEDVSIHTVFLGTHENNASAGGYISQFSNEIAGFKVDIQLDHTVNEMDFGEKYFESIDAAGTAVKNYYNSLMDKSKVYEISNVNIDKGNQTITSVVNINKTLSIIRDQDTSALGRSFYSIIDTFSCASQQMQALIYKIDGIERKCTNNLWMRRIELEYTRPIYNTDGFGQFASISKTKVIQMNNTKWRIADFEYGVDLPSNPIRARVSLAHEIPEMVTNTEEYKAS